MRNTVWLVSFSYHQSSHQMTINLNEPESNAVPNQPNNWTALWVIIPLISVVLIAFLLLTKISKKRLLKKSGRI